MTFTGDSSQVHVCSKGVRAEMEELLCNMARDEEEGKTKLCVNCRYCDRAAYDTDGLYCLCNHPSVGYVSKVSGKVQYPPCSLERLNGRVCGPCGNNFELAPPADRNPGLLGRLFSFFGGK